ncbi:MAG: hypothetical protein P8M79_03670 [Alphaproteobacteria bacterium]|nr:hypothetical protein [Alphaproteobacteria bacterium]
MSPAILRVSGGDDVQFLFATLIFTTLVVLPVRADQNDAKLGNLFRQLQSAQELAQA